MANAMALSPPKKQAKNPKRLSAPAQSLAASGLKNQVNKDNNNNNNNKDNKNDDAVDLLDLFSSNDNSNSNNNNNNNNNANKNNDNSNPFDNDNPFESFGNPFDDEIIEDDKQKQQNNNNNLKDFVNPYSKRDSGMQPDLLFDPSMWDTPNSNNNNNKNRLSMNSHNSDSNNNNNNNIFDIDEILNNNNNKPRSQSQSSPQDSNNNNDNKQRLSQGSIPQQSSSSSSSSVSIAINKNNNNIKFAAKSVLTPVSEDKQMKVDKNNKSKHEDEEDENEPEGGEEGEGKIKKSNNKNNKKKNEDEDDKDEEDSESSSHSNKNKAQKEEDLENIKEIANVKEIPKDESNKENDNKDNKKINTNALEELHRGTALLKYPRHHGFPHFKFVQLSKDNCKIQWFSKKKPLHETCIHIKDVKEIIHGQQTEPFKKYNQKSLDKASFSIIHSNKYSSLDVVAKSIDEALMWVKTITILKKKYEENNKQEEILKKLDYLDVGINFHDRNRPKSRQGSGNFIRGNNSQQHKVDPFVLKQIEKDMDILIKTFKKVSAMINNEDLMKSYEHNYILSVLSELEERIEELTHEVRNTKDTELSKRDVWRCTVDITALQEKVEALLKYGPPDVVNNNSKRRSNFF